MITTVALANVTYFFFMERTFKIYSLGNFEANNTIFLTLISMLSIRSPRFIYLSVASLYP